jgi:hypothetical protein
MLISFSGEKGTPSELVGDDMSQMLRAIGDWNNFTSQRPVFSLASTYNFPIAKG